MRKSKSISLVVMRVSGSSMQPFLESGWRVLVDTSVEDTDLRLGDIVAVKLKSGRLLLHRLVKRQKNGDLCTQGDNRALREGPLHPKQIVGRLVGIEDSIHEGCWLGQRPFAGRILAVISSLRPRKLVRPAQMLVKPFYFAASYRAVIDYLSQPPRVVGASGSDSDNIEFQELGDEFVIHDKRSGDIHVLNNQAHAIYQWAKEGLSREIIVSKMASAYPNEDRDNLRKSVEEVMETFESLDIL